MTYFTFLACFVFIPILVLLIITWLDNRANRTIPGFDSKKVALIIAVHVFLALTYTTPWDNYLIASGVWSYNPDLVTGITIGYVPIEEYTFFVVETILSGLWWWFLARRIGGSGSRWSGSRWSGSRWSSSWWSSSVAYRDPANRDPARNPKLVYPSTFLLSASWLFFTYQFFFGPDSWNYLGIIFFWALPAILPQLLFGADILWYHRKLVFWTVFVPGLYLSLTDIIALNATTWQISKAQTLGINFFGILPLEEVVFFFITNVLIGFGMTLMLSDLGQQRFADWKMRGFKGLP